MARKFRPEAWFGTFDKAQQRFVTETLGDSVKHPEVWARVIIGVTPQGEYYNRLWRGELTFETAMEKYLSNIT